MSENLVYGFSSTKLSFNEDIEMPYCRKQPLLSRPTKFYNKNCEMIENNFFMYLVKKL